MPPMSTTFTVGSSRTDVAMKALLVMTVTSRPSAASCATSRAQQLPLSTMTVSPSRTSSAARRAMARFSS